MLGSFLYGDRKLRLYKDGSLQTTSTALTDNIRAGINLTFFRPGDVVAAQATSGVKLSEIAVYGEYLDAEAALREYNGTFSAAQPLKAYWKMDEGTGTALDDSGPSGYDGVMNGGLSWNAEGTPILSEALTWASAEIFHTLAAPASHRYWRTLIESPAGTETMKKILLLNRALGAFEKGVA